MKKTTIWKLVAMALLVAVTLPLVSALAPTTVSAVTIVPPLPWAMEQYGQHHGGIYYTAKAPELDGTPDADVYTQVDIYDDQAGNFDGLFTSATPDGSEVYELATEYCPDKIAIYSAYDAEYLYFCIETNTRTTDEGYGITACFGFNFAEVTQKAAQEGTSLRYEIAPGQTEVAGANHFLKTDTSPDRIFDSTAEESGYLVNDTAYEFKVAWADVAPAGKSVGADFDRMYVSFVIDFFDGGSEQYLVYGVPNNASFLNSERMTVGSAFASAGEENVGTYTPNVLELLGDKGEYTVAPSLSVKRTDKNTTNERTFEATLTLEGVDAETVSEAGILFAADAGAVGGKNLVWSENGDHVIRTSTKEDKDTLTYCVSFTTSAADYGKYFSIRPFVKYDTAKGNVVYGQYYSNTPSYYDAEDVKYTSYMNVLMIGCSFSNYYLDELVRMAAEDGIYMTAVRSYKSGAKAYEHWAWLMNDYKSNDKEVLTRKVFTPENSVAGQNTGYYTLNEILSYADWDVISAQDHYGGSLSYDDGYELCMQSTMPYLPNLFRYLDVNYPDADLYLNETWAFQIGYGYKNNANLNIEYEYDENGNIKDGRLVGGDRNTSVAAVSCMLNVAQQKKHYENIKNCTYDFSELTGVPLIPSGDAWQLARYNPVIDDNLCDRGAKSDAFHDGEEGGGQFLNACVWYEMLTGNDCRKNAWRPTTYTLTEEQVKVLQEAAHEAVKQYKLTGSFLNATINND